MIKKILSYEIPVTLNTPDFVHSWSTWLEHLREKRKYPTSHGIRLQLKKMEEIGLERAIKAIDHSIEHNYQGLFEPNGFASQNGHKPSKPERKRFISHSDAAYGHLLGLLQGNWQDKKEDVINLAKQLNRIALISLPFEERKIIMEWMK